MYAEHGRFNRPQKKDILETTTCRKVHRNTVPWTLTLLNAIFAALTIYLSLRYEPRCPGELSDKRYHNAGLNPALKATSIYSPLFDEIDLSLQPHKLDGSFKNTSSIFRQAPSPEVDAAWDFFSGSIFTTTSFALAESQKRPETAVKAPESWGRGDDAYIFQLDVFHQIHCLNWLRKDLNWEYYWGDERPSQWWLDHRAHCIHILLQTLMCHADLDIVPYNWVPRHGQGPELVPDPDFNVVKMCRNFEAVVAWAETNQVEDAQEKRKHLKAPIDAVASEWPY
ncbi:hypothetical protein M409DRAFT_28296 [Zasmidium cellare ATCC 36951]|uniref:Tat pathway signal sequence n=1 Tax=Zasmidium cellare ATCC 36951 TaxID=1080233 RepID=A0A6A6C2B7_ZASCE|nr:uncharacterized protein M409DRAFT_28296 [Zasmidium cellare ATCC 36951]KAF2161257.1 hypothetical protein M409DRAFT_28296 [Zasmidium cellare ATCC 36951]